MKYDEFYSLRISEVIEFIEISKQNEIDNINIQFNLFGTLCSVIANFSMGKPKNKKFKSKDFFKPIDNRKIEKKKIQTSEEMSKILEAMTIAMGGEVKK